MYTHECTELHSKACYIILIGRVAFIHILHPLDTSIPRVCVHSCVLLLRLCLKAHLSACTREHSVCVCARVRVCVRVCVSVCVFTQLFIPMTIHLIIVSFVHVSFTANLKQRS